MQHTERIHIAPGILGRLIRAEGRIKPHEEMWPDVAQPHGRMKRRTSSKTAFLHLLRKRSEKHRGPIATTWLQEGDDGANGGALGTRENYQYHFENTARANYARQTYSLPCHSTSQHTE